MVFSSLKDFFDYINENCEYVILRNWEKIEDNINNGEDIDVLVTDKDKFVELIGAFSKYEDTSRANYYFLIEKKKCRIDVRYVGDGYYPVLWEKQFINNRIFEKNVNAFVLNSKDYYSALLYHSLIQKPCLSSKYLEKLNRLTGKELDGNQYIKELQSKLKDNNSFISLPIDFGVYINLKFIKENNMPCDFKWTNVFLRNFRKLLFKIRKKIKEKS